MFDEYDAMRQAALVKDARDRKLRNADKLLKAARLVLDRWDRGDLAAAVRSLQAAADAMEG